MGDATPPAQRANRVGLAVLAATAAGLLVAGFWRMFAHFPGYDDEGYILLSVRSYLEHGDLYGRVYTQYGPAFYALFDGLHRLAGVVPDHAFARWFTLALWFGGSAALGGLVGRATGSRPMAWFTWVAAFLYLHQLSEEAFHPGALVVGLLPAAWWAMAELPRRGKPVAAAAVAGAAAAFLGLLKVNVGVLFAAGWLLWVGLAAARTRGQTAAVVAGGVVFAAALLHGLWTEAWVQVFLAVIASGLIGLGATVGEGQRAESAGASADAASRELGPPMGGDRESRARFVAASQELGPPARGATVGDGQRAESAGAGAAASAACVAGAGMVALAAVLPVLARGTSWAELLDGVVLRPLRHADAYSFAVDWRPGTLALALASVMTLAAHRRLADGGRTEAADRLLAGLRLAQLLGLVVAVALLEHFRVIGAVFSYALPWLWTWLAPLHGAEAAAGDRRARELVACGVLLQALHAYPVGGIQIGWGSFPLFALAAMAVPETAAWLVRQTGVAARAGRGLVAALVIVAAAKAGWTAVEWQRTWLDRVPLDLPGAGALRVTEAEAATYRTLTTNAVLHADTLFSLPGRFSFNLWSACPAPTLRNTTVWYSLLDEREQAEIAAALARAPRAAVIVDVTLLAILHASGAPPAGRLYDHLLAEYRPAFAIDRLGFWVRRGRAIAPVGTAWRTTEAAGGGLRLCLIGAGEQVSELVVRDPALPDAPARVLSPANARLVVQPVDPAGRPTAPAREATWPLVVNGLAWVTVSSEALEGLGEAAGFRCEMKSAGGQLVAVAPFVDPP